MADSKLTELGTIASTDDADLIYIVDDPSGTPLEKKVALSTLVAHNRAYGDIYVNAGSGTQGVTPADTYVKVTQFTANGISSGAAGTS